MYFKNKQVMNEIIIAILNLIGIIASSIGVVYVRDKIKNKKRKIITDTYTHKAECWMILDKITSDIRKQLNAKGVYIAYFHNGGKFCNGINMDKFTVIAEDYDISIVNSYKVTYKNVLTSLMPYTILRLYRDGQHVFRLSNATEYHSSFYKNELKYRGIKTAVSILIKDLNTDIPIGFISVESEDDFQPDLHFMNTLWKNHNKISRSMTMVIDKDQDEEDEKEEI